jgi:hypothetical protein
VALRQKSQPEVLGDVGVLVFVYKNVAEPPAILLQQVLVLLEDVDDVEQQIAEIDGVERLSRAWYAA